MSDFPNIEALLQGCVSGRYTEWPKLREEAQQLKQERDEAIELFESINEHLNTGSDDGVCTIFAGSWFHKQIKAFLKKIGDV